MHSRIFQLEESKKEVEDNFLKENEIIDNYYWFLNRIADYVVDISDEKVRDENIKWFVDDVLKTKNDENLFEVDDEQKSITFFPGFKYRYFVKRYNHLKQIVNEIELDEFCKQWSIKIDEIEDTIEDRFGFYIFNEEDGLITLDSFIRSLPNTDEITYYFGGILDYHF